MLLNLVRLYIGTQPTIPSNEDYCCDKHNKIGSKKLTPPYWLSSQNRSTAARGRHYKRGDLHARKLCKCRAGKKFRRSKQIRKDGENFNFIAIIVALPPYLYCFIFSYEKEGVSVRVFRAFYIRTNRSARTR